MLKIVYTEKVKNDFREIHSYIAEDSMYHAFKVIESIEHTISLLETFPRLGKDIGDHHHIIVEKNYGYSIVYRIDADILYILGVYKYKNSWR